MPEKQKYNINKRTFYSFVDSSMYEHFAEKVGAKTAIINFPEDWNYVAHLWITVHIWSNFDNK